MAKNVNLDELLRAIHNAVLEAQKLTEQQHIRQLHHYFTWPDQAAGQADFIADGLTLTGGKARTWTIDVPSLHPEAKPGDTMKLAVPIMSLVPPTALKIKNFLVEFKAGLDGFSEGEPVKSSTPYLPGDIPEHKGPITIDMGGISGGFFRKKRNLAKIRIEFEGSEPAESFLRINDHLIKSIL